MHCDMLKIQDGVAIVEKLNSAHSYLCQGSRKHSEVHSHSGCMPWTFDGYVRSAFAQFFNSAWELLNQSLFIFLFVYTLLLSDVVLPDSSSVLII